MQQEAERERGAAIANGETAVPEPALPSIPYWQCRIIMTRPDFLEGAWRRSGGALSGFERPYTKAREQSSTG